MSQCGSIDFIDGGTIKGATIIQSQVVNSRITGSVFETGSIEALADIDEASTVKIANAVAALPPAQLRVLAQAIFAALSVTSAATPTSSAATRIPTTILGGRESLLGTPSMFANFGDHVIPLYEKS